MKIFSKIDNTVQICSIIKKNYIKSGSQFYSNNNEYLQFISLKSNSDFIVKPHKHLLNHRKTSLTQEAWIIIKGKVQVIFHDIDNTKIYEDTLSAGDACILFSGAHSLKNLTKEVLLYEVKNGPYDENFVDMEKI